MGIYLEVIVQNQFADAVVLNATLRDRLFEVSVKAKDLWVGATSCNSPYNQRDSYTTPTFRSFSTH